jgi:hypothetical protein
LGSEVEPLLAGRSRCVSLCFGSERQHGLLAINVGYVNVLFACIYVSVIPLDSFQSMLAASPLTPKQRVVHKLA